MTVIGKDVEVAQCRHEPLTGLAGTAVDETLHTVTISTRGEETQVLKHTATFTIAGEQVDGAEFERRPEEFI